MSLRTTPWRNTIHHISSYRSDHKVLLKIISCLYLMETDRKKAIRGPGRPDGAVLCEVSPIRQSTAMPRRGVLSDARARWHPRSVERCRNPSFHQSGGGSAAVSSADNMNNY